MRPEEILEDLVRPNIRRLEPYRCARETVREGILLDANENPFLRRCGKALLNRYPDPYQMELREALAEWVGVRPEMVLAGVGSDEVLDWIFKVFCAGHAVSVAEPTYGMYRVLADIYDVPVRDIPLGLGFRFDASRFLDVVTPDERVLFLCTPNNPTGNLLDRSEIERVLAEWRGVVVVDEAYVEFSDGISLAGESDRFPNLIVLRTFSKAFGRAGLRLGYAVAHPAAIQYFLKVKAPYNLSACTQAEGLEALAAAEECRREIKLIRCERGRVAEALRNLPGIEAVYPSQANFILFRCEGAAEICRSLLDEGIVVRDRSGLPGLENCIRVSIGTPDENTVFLGRLRRHLEERKSHESSQSRS